MDQPPQDPAALPRALTALLLAEPGVWTAKRAAEHLGVTERQARYALGKLPGRGWAVHREHARAPITLTHPDRPDLVPPVFDRAPQIDEARATLEDLRRQIREAESLLAELDRRVQDHPFYRAELERHQATKKAPASEPAGATGT